MYFLLWGISLLLTYYLLVELAELPKDEFVLCFSIKMLELLIMGKITEEKCWGEKHNKREGLVFAAVCLYVKKRHWLFQSSHLLKIYIIHIFRKRNKKGEKNGKGLRHFSMKVCEKVQRKGTTSYNEVADELVAEFSTTDNHISPNESVSIWEVSDMWTEWGKRNFFWDFCISFLLLKETVQTLPEFTHLL